MTPLWRSKSLEYVDGHITIYNEFFDRLTIDAARRVFSAAKARR